jgi:segregation and condensation protein B
LFSSHTTSLGSRLGSSSLRYRRDRRGLEPRRSWQGSLGQAAKSEPTEASPTTRDRRLARVEAVLLVAREPLSSRRLAMLANLADGTEARTLVGKLNTMYEQATTAFRVEDIAGGFRLMSQPKFSPWLRRVCDAPAEVRLSGPALETLAVVAYRQPVLRVDIEAVRGVQCGEILRQLLERDLVRIAGRSEELGRPFLYGTTRQFLQLFGLRNLDNLPRVELFRSAEENAKTNEAEAAHSQDETGDEEVTTTIEPVDTPDPLEQPAPGAGPAGAAPDVEAVILDDHGEFEDDKDEDDGDGDDDEGGYDLYGDYDECEDDTITDDEDVDDEDVDDDDEDVDDDDVDDADVEDADWKEVEGDDKVDDEDEDWGDYDDDDVDDDDNKEDDKEDDI